MYLKIQFENILADFNFIIFCLITFTLPSAHPFRTPSGPAAVQHLTSHQQQHTQNFSGKLLKCQPIRFHRKRRLEASDSLGLCYVDTWINIKLSLGLGTECRHSCWWGNLILWIIIRFGKENTNLSGWRREICKTSVLKCSSEIGTHLDKPKYKMECSLRAKISMFVSINLSLEYYPNCCYYVSLILSTLLRWRCCMEGTNY